MLKTLSLLTRHLRKMLGNERGETLLDDADAGAAAGAAGASGNWYDGLPDPIKTIPDITKYKSPEEFRKGYDNKNELIGRKGVIVPTEKSTPEELNSFFNSLGRPEKPEAYKLSPVENLHPEIKVSPESQKAFFEEAHKRGLTNQQADGLNKWYLSGVSQMLATRDKAQAENMQKSLNTLRTEWGADFDKNMALATRMVKNFGGKEALDSFGDLGNNPGVLKFLANVGKRFAEDSIDKMGVSDLTTSSSDARKQINSIKTDKNNPNYAAFWNENDPKHDEVVKMLSKLYEVEAGGE
jgi:hypothetical protein